MEAAINESNIEPANPDATLYLDLPSFVEPPYADPHVR
jgi:hypothetical protein